MIRNWDCNDRQVKYTPKQDSYPPPPPTWRNSFQQNPNIEWRRSGGDRRVLVLCSSTWIEINGLKFYYIHQIGCILMKPNFTTHRLDV